MFGGQSFTPATKVLTASGALVAISKLRKGEKVLATNTKTGKTRAETVAAVLVHHDTDRYDLKISTGGKTAVIHTTRSHLFWDASSRRWVKAAALRHGMHLRTSNGATATVIGGHNPKNAAGWMWDLTIPGDHDFYIKAATTAVLVHNCSVDLNAEEQAGGHTIARHVGMSDAQLMARNIPYASTFNDLATAESVTGDNVAANQTEISQWLAGSGTNLAIQNGVSSSVGRIYEQATGQFLDPAEVNTVLVRSATMRAGYFIRTSYLLP